MVQFHSDFMLVLCLSTAFCCGDFVGDCSERSNSSESLTSLHNKISLAYPFFFGKKRGCWDLVQPRRDICHHRHRASFGGLVRSEQTGIVLGRLQHVQSECTLPTKKDRISQTTFAREDRGGCQAWSVLVLPTA